MTDWEYFRSSSTTKHGHRTLSQKGGDIPFGGIRGATIEPQDALRFDRLLLLAKDTRGQQILKADAPKQFRANPIGYAVDDLSAILRRVDVGPKRPLAEGHVDDVDDRFRNFAGIGVSGLQGSKTLQRHIRQASIRPLIVFGSAGKVGGRTGVSEVIGTRCERTGHDDGSLDACVYRKPYPSGGGDGIA